jgi:phospholipid/cholesterol/gamma-HCH transport system substrate-binding protein
MDKALNDVQLITDKVSRGEGSLGQLVNNDTLYSELEAASAELNSLLEDIKLHPSRYVKVSVFGGKNNDAYEAPKNKKEKK